MNFNENFDNIFIDSKKSFEIEDKDRAINQNEEKTKKLSYTTNEGDIYVNYFLNENENLSKMDSLVEDSSSEEEVTFIREISTPLLNNSRVPPRVERRRYMNQRNKISKTIGICCIFTFIVTLITVIILIFLPSNVYKTINSKIKSTFLKTDIEEIVGCDQLIIKDIWVKSYPRMLSEGAIRLINIDNDDILDIVIPFGTNVVKSDISHFVCSIYYPGQNRCFGGLLALNGKNGDILWRYDSVGEIYALSCAEDLNKDGWFDCLGAGRVGTLAAVSGRDGSELWGFDKNPDRNSIMNLYTPQFIDDVDEDGVKDIVEIHGGDPVAKPNEMNRLIAKVMVFSGRTGRILASKSVSDNHESYYSPQLLNAGDGVKSILYGTGGETFPGSLFVTSLQRLLYSNPESKLRSDKIYQGPMKGVMTPPVLVDLNSDGRADIVICPFGDVCLAIDGVTFKQIWIFDEINNSETYATPAAGFYNDDNIPDIFIQLFVGLGYPVYFYGETVILDGRNGKVIKKLTRSNNVVTTSPLTVSVEGKGNDIFLYWVQLCRGHENDVDKTPFQNVPQYLLSRAHVCKIRFNTTTESLYLAHGRNLVNKIYKDIQIYNSENYYHIQNDIKINSSFLIEQYLSRHPELRKLHRLYKDTMNKEDENSVDLRRRKYHNKLLKDQNINEKIDLNDDSIHRSIDFERQTKDPDEEKGIEEQYIRDLLKNIREKDQSMDEDKPLIRTKRHNGAHDGEGHQRLIGTGTLAPPMLNFKHKDINQSIDIIFSTYWSTAKEVLLQTKNEMKCNKKWKDSEYQRFKGSSKFYHYDHDHYSEYGNRYCAQKYGRRSSVSNLEKGMTIFNSHVGQLTLFRKRLKCTCSSQLKSNQRCSHILPFHLQAWPAYLGLSGTAYWNSSYYSLHNV